MRDAPDLEAATRFAATDPYVVYEIFATWEILASEQGFPERS